MPLSRRGALTLLASAAGTELFSGCAGRRPPSAAIRRPAARADPAPPRIVWGTWPQYLDGTARKHPTLAAFSAGTGIAVDYREDVNSNEEFVARIRPALAAHRPCGYDVIALTGWMAARLARSGWLRRLDTAVMPHADGVLPALARPDWDPDQAYSRPWQAGLTGIAYNAAQVDRPVFGVTELLSRRDLHGRVALLSEFNDTVGMVMLRRGSDPTDFRVAEAEAALDDIAAAVRSGQVKAILGNDYLPRMIAGEFAAGLVWSGDVIQAQAQNPYIKFVPPAEGMMAWADHMLVPAGSTQVEAVSELIDYYYEPEVAAAVAAEVNYICPVQGAREAMASLNPRLQDNPLIFPDDELLDRSHVFATMDPADDDRLRARFASIAGTPT